ncbi:hypothetical protein [Amycolatopsis sp. NPDC051372]|uniref:hypothetical protein n=1 Tax=Amycolatopsis sp. NPDC051372 TaxID=3155669 RepID=UPI00343C3729
MYVIDRSAPPSLVVEVPHPGFDLRTELFGVDLFRQVPGAVLLVAGAHRKATTATPTSHTKRIRCSTSSRPRWRPAGCLQSAVAHSM